jgi:hypothetical protein
MNILYFPSSTIFLWQKATYIIALYAMKMYNVYRSKDPYIPELGTKWNSQLPD